jgi:hypothetical protein
VIAPFVDDQGDNPTLEIIVMERLVFSIASYIATIYKIGWGYLYYVHKIKESLTEGQYTSQYTWFDMIRCSFSLAGPTFVEKQS